MNSRHEKISRAAYELYEKGGCVPGMDEANWLAAEKALAGGEKPIKRRRVTKKSPASTTAKKRKVKK